jgi:hypothetical protein
MFLFDLQKHQHTVPVFWRATQANNSVH